MSTPVIWGDLVLDGGGNTWSKRERPPGGPRSDAREEERALEAAFERMVAEYRQLVLRTAYRLLGNAADAQDASQEVFLKLMTHFHDIESDASGWLYRVTVNICKDHYRRPEFRRRLEAPSPKALRRGAYDRVEGDRAVQAVDPAPGPEQAVSEAAELEHRKRLLMEGIAELPQREREAVVLRDIEGLSTRQVAAILEVQEVTVRTLTAKARLKLAKFVRKRMLLERHGARPADRPSGGNHDV